MTKRLRKFWGYKHTSGTIHTKVFFDQMDIVEANESPFVAHLMVPFEASDITEAQEKVQKYFNLNEKSNSI